MGFTGARRVAGIGVGLAALLLAGCDYVHPPFLDRVDAPVVLTGADVPEAIGLDPGRVVAYRWRDGWHQIPVQIDERAEVPFGVQPGSNQSVGVEGSVYGNAAGEVSALQYTDPDTFVGPDPDPTIDADDELVFMARDAGEVVPAGTARPAGTVAPGRQVELATPAGHLGFAYLFYGAPDADPAAGSDYVDYDFELTSGDYRTTYRRADGPNPETSTVTAERYEVDFLDRWKTVGLRVDGSDTDLLDGFKARFSFSTCGRSNETFAEAEGAFVANIDGPIRAIRSYVGANSGPLTQETLYFYANRIDVVTDLRVHAIPSVMSFIDFSAAASGMTYGSSELGGTTVPIDGNPDAVPTALPAWQYAAGDQGLVSWIDTLETDIDGLDRIELDWTDDSDPGFEECWGSDGLYGAAATTIDEYIPNTDPRGSTFASLRSRRVIGLWPSELDATTWVPLWADAVAGELAVTITDGP